MSITHRHSSFRVGDRVKIDFGRRKVTGTIVEDRGAIGVQGRRLFRVNVPMDPFEPTTVELPEDEIEAVQAETGGGAALKKEQVMEYLESGGLISILRSNLAGGRNQPRVWLCYDNLGNVTHTFIPERGVIGGQLVPFLALQDGKIFRLKREEVVSFLETFGLNRRAAEEVVSHVGTSP